MIALLAMPMMRRLFIGVVVVVSLLAGLLWLRLDAAHDAIQDIKNEALTQEQETRHDAEIAARAAERDGAAERLRRGNF